MKSTILLTISIITLFAVGQVQGLQCKQCNKEELNGEPGDGVIDGCNEDSSDIKECDTQYDVCLAYRKTFTYDNGDRVDLKYRCGLAADTTGDGSDSKFCTDWVTEYSSGGPPGGKDFVCVRSSCTPEDVCNRELADNADNADEADENCETQFCNGSQTPQMRVLIAVAMILLYGLV